MGTFELLWEPVNVNGVEISKWNIVYYNEDGTEYTKENYSCNGIVIDSEIRPGYILKINQ